MEKCVGAGDKEVVTNEDDSENKENVPVEPEKDETVPPKIIIEEVDEELLTPLSKINLKWRRKSAGYSTTDSVASVSAISHSNQSQPKNVPQSAKKLVRTTSTPMTQLLSKPTSLDSLCGSSYQASSIEQSSGNETDQSASITSINCSPSPAILMKRNEFPIQRAKQMRNRLSKAQTPLRQVMSKSIQRAIMEQRNERTKLTANVRMPRKMIFDSMSSSDGSIDEPLVGGRSKTPNVSGVLDLRTTPVLKRTMSAPLVPRTYYYQEQQDERLHSRRRSDESLIAQALIEEHYKRSDFRAKINAISDNVINETQYEPGVISIPLTPEIETNETQLNDHNTASGIFKSCLEYENGVTPFKLPTVKKSAIVTPMMSAPENSFVNEVWYTPGQILTNVEPPKLQKSFRASDPEPDIEDEVFAPTDEIPAEQPQSRIWRLFSTVIKIASGSLTETTDNQITKRSPTSKPSIVKRSLTHLGLIRPAKRPSYTKSSPAQHLKRKRNTSSQSSLNNDGTATIPELRSPLAKKYKSITGRKPIQRMRSK